MAPIPCAIQIAMDVDAANATYPEPFVIDQQSSWVSVHEVHFGDKQI
jgi:hypothetical protein